MYLRTNNGVGISEMLIFSDSATTTPGTRDTSFTIYFANNVEFSIKANLETGMPQFFIHTMFKLCSFKSIENFQDFFFKTLF